MLKASNKKKINKLLREYDAKEDKSKNRVSTALPTGDSTGNSAVEFGRPGRFNQREPKFEGIDESERRKLLPPNPPVGFREVDFQSKPSLGKDSRSFRAEHQDAGRTEGRSEAPKRRVGAEILKERWKREKERKRYDETPQRESKY